MPRILNRAIVQSMRQYAQQCTGSAMLRKLLHFLDRNLSSIIATALATRAPSAPVAAAKPNATTDSSAARAKAVQTQSMNSAVENSDDAWTPEQQAALEKALARTQGVHLSCRIKCCSQSS